MLWNNAISIQAMKYFYRNAIVCIKFADRKFQVVLTEVQDGCYHLQYLHICKLLHGWKATVTNGIKL